MTTSLSTVTILHDPILIKLVKARVDPRNMKRARRTTKPRPFVADKGVHKDRGRVLVARMLYLTRTKILDVSLEKFGELVSEDYRRALILNGVTQKEADGFSSLTATTVMRVEDNSAIRGCEPSTLTLICPRIGNPLTSEAFSPLDIQALYQGYLDTDLDVFSDLIESDGYLTLARNVNTTKDKELFYTSD